MDVYPETPDEEEYGEQIMQNKRHMKSPLHEQWRTATKQDCLPCIKSTL